MLLFLPEGVLSITAHKKRDFDLTVRALNRKVIRGYFDVDVYYDNTKDLPYHASIMRPQLQEVMFTLLENMEYNHLKGAGGGTRYGTLLNHIHESIRLYPDYEVASQPLPKESEPQVPEAAQMFAGMVLQNASGKRPKPDWLGFYRS